MRSPRGVSLTSPQRAADFSNKKRDELTRQRKKRGLVLANRMAPFIVTLLVVSLASNMASWLNVAAILALLPLWLFSTKRATADRWLGPKKAIQFAVLAYGFWIFSYLVSTAHPAGLFSYDFLRFKGALLIGYLPLLLLGDVQLSSRFVLRLIWTYLVTLAMVAASGAGLILLLGLGHRSFLNMPILKNVLWIGVGHEMPVMLLGLYRTHMTAGNQYAIASLMALCLILRGTKPRLASWPTLVFICLFGGMLLSGARTAYVAFAGAFLFLFVRQKEYLKPLVKIAMPVCLTLLILLIAVPSISTRALSTVDYGQQDTNVMSRFRIYGEAAKYFTASPLIGIGYGRFDDLGKSYWGIRHLVYISTSAQPAGDLEDTEYSMRAHDSYLQFLAEGGIVGFFLMMGIWLSTYRWAGLLRRRFRPESHGAALCEAVRAAVLVTFFSSVTGTTMMMATTPLTVFTIVGLLRNLACSEARTYSLAGHPTLPTAIRLRQSPGFAIG